MCGSLHPEDSGLPGTDNKTSQDACRAWVQKGNNFQQLSHFSKCLFYLIFFFFFLELNFSLLIPGFAFRRNSLPIERGESSFPVKSRGRSGRVEDKRHKPCPTNLSPGSRADKVWILELLAEWPFVSQAGDLISFSFSDLQNRNDAYT